jgi:hypothetical protein
MTPKHVRSEFVRRCEAGFAKHNPGDRKSLVLHLDARMADVCSVITYLLDEAQSLRDELARMKGDGK